MYKSPSDCPASAFLKRGHQLSSWLLAVKQQLLNSPPSPASLIGIFQNSKTYTERSRAVASEQCFLLTVFVVGSVRSPLQAPLPDRLLPTGGAVWRGSGTLREEVRHWKWAPGVIDSPHFLLSFSASCLWIKMWSASFLLLPQGTPSLLWWTLSFWNWSQNKPFFPWVAFGQSFITATESN